MKPLDPPPLEPHHVSHYLAACKIAGVPVAQTDAVDLRALIEHLSRLSIPDAVKLLRKRATKCPATKCSPLEIQK